MQVVGGRARLSGKEAIALLKAHQKKVAAEAKIAERLRLLPVEFAQIKSTYTAVLDRINEELAETGDVNSFGHASLRALDEEGITQNPDMTPKEIFKIFNHGFLRDVRRLLDDKFGKVTINTKTIDGFKFEEYYYDSPTLKHSEVLDGWAFCGGDYVPEHSRLKFDNQQHVAALINDVKQFSKELTALNEQVRELGLSAA